MKAWNFPKTKTFDLEAFLNEANLMLRLYAREELDATTLERHVENMGERYKGRVFIQDKYLFPTLEKFEEFLRGLVPPDVVSSMSKHEKAHFDTAVHLGHNVMYGVWLSDYGGDMPSVYPFVEHTFNNVSGRDQKEIALAPHNPSDLDKSLEKI